MRIFFVTIAAAASALLFALPAIATTTKGQLFHDGAVVGTVVTPAPIAPGSGSDPFYKVTNGTSGQLGIAGVAPGDGPYHGGSWQVYLVTFNPGGQAVPAHLRRRRVRGQRPRRRHGDAGRKRGLSLSGRPALRKVRLSMKGPLTQKRGAFALAILVALATVVVAGTSVAGARSTSTPAHARLILRKSEFGKVIFDSNGNVVYMFGRDKVTYNHHPLYFYSADKHGKIMCQHAVMHGGIWLVLKANGRPNMMKGKMQM